MNQLSKELRIENYNLFMGQIDQIKDGYDIDHVKQDEFGNHKAMPITVEVLFDLGFKKEPNYVFTFNNSDLILRKAGESYLVYLFANAITAIKNVHELQNIFMSLRSIELKLKSYKE